MRLQQLAALQDRGCAGLECGALRTFAVIRCLFGIGGCAELASDRLRRPFAFPCSVMQDSHDSVWGLCHVFLCKKIIQQGCCRCTSGVVKATVPTCNPL